MSHTEMQNGTWRLFLANEELGAVGVHGVDLKGLRASQRSLNLM